MAAPTKQADIVVISETYGTPDNQNRAHPFITRLTYTDGVLTKAEEIMMNGVTEVLRKETVLTYTDGVLTSAREKIFALDGVTVEHDYTDTLTYTDGALTGVERTVTV